MSLRLAVGSYVDVRDSVGNWMEAEVVEVRRCCRPQ